MEPVKIKITHDLLTPSETKDFEGVIFDATFNFAGCEFKADGPLNYHAHVLNSGGGVLFVSGEVEVSLDTECVRCLEPVTYDIDGEIEGYIALTDSPKLPKDVGEDELIECAADHIVDISGLIEGAVTLELPIQPLCSEDCKGIEFEHDDDAAGEIHPFEVLKNYKFD